LLPFFRQEGKMQIGDPVKLTGKVLDIVTVNQVTSVLVQSDDTPAAPVREFWFPQDQLQANPPPEPASTPATVP